MRALYLAALLAPLAVGLIGCDRFAVEEDRGMLLRGDWRSTVDGLTIVFNEDGTYLVTPVDGEVPIAGRYTVEGVGITILDDADTAACVGVAGRYTVTVSVSEWTAQFFLVDDSCAPRIEHMRALWRRAT
jgi:hypothetical protein